MNRTVEVPSRLLIINYQKNKHTEDNMSLNFYNLDTEQKNIPEYDMSENILNRKTSTHAKSSRNNQLSKDYILQSLKVDIRVRKFEERNDSIIVEFNTLEDSLSFYKQHIKMVNMSFLADFGYNIFFTDWSISGYFPDQMYINHKPFNNNCQKDYNSYSCDKLDSIPQGVSMEELYSRIDHFNSLKSLYSEDKLQKLNIKDGISKEELLDEIMKDTDFVIKNAKELSVGSATNVFLQKRIKEMTEDELCRFITKLGNDISAISATKHGAYTIQALISVCITTKTQNLICSYFGENGKHLILHEVGNYSIQKIMIFNLNYVFDLIVSNLSSILADSLGFKILKRCIPVMKTKKDQIKVELNRISKTDDKKVQELLNLI